MRIKLDAKQRSFTRIAVWTFTVCLLITVAVWRFDTISSIFKNLLSVMAPLIIGLIMAYLLSPMVNWFDKKYAKLTDRKKPHPRLKRTLSVSTTMLIVVAVIVGLVAAILPELISSIKNLITNLPDYLRNVTDWITKRVSGLEHSHPQLYSRLMSIWNSAQDSVTNLAHQYEPKLDSIISGGGDVLSIVTTSAISVVTWVTNFLIGMITSIYLLYNKERYLAQVRKLLYATLPEKGVHKFLRIGSHVSYTFMHFLSGKTLDSVIIGLLCFIGLTIIGTPYVTLISIIIGVTNIIPFFGPIIGAIPSGFLILISDPGKVIPFVIFIIILQQFDGNILGPTILGDSLGLPMFWILFAIIVGGGMFGFIGMVVFVPLFAAIYALLSDFLKERLDKKGLPIEDESYMTNEIHYADKPDQIVGDKTLKEKPEMKDSGDDSPDQPPQEPQTEVSAEPPQEEETRDETNDQ